MMSKIRWQAPTVTAATAATDSSSARRTAAVASPLPSSRSAGTRTPSRAMVEWRTPASMGTTSSACTAEPGTSTTRTSPSRRTATAISSAVAPSTT